jgi:hypothetical protein
MALEACGYRFEDMVCFSAREADGRIAEESMATPIVKDSAGQKLAVCLLRLPREKGVGSPKHRQK